MEPCRLSQGKFGTLCNERRDWGAGEHLVREHRFHDRIEFPMALTIMIKVKEYCQKHCEWNGKEGVSNIDIPEMDQPTTILSRIEGFARWQGLEFNAAHAPHVNETGEEDDGERGSVILDELPHVALEERAAPNDSADVCYYEHQEGYRDGQVSTRVSGCPLPGKDLNAFLKVDEGHVKTEDVAAETRDVGESIASVGDGQSPVHHH